MIISFADKAVVSEELLKTAHAKYCIWQANKSSLLCWNTADKPVIESG
jgi:hypothetical protein